MTQTVPEKILEKELELKICQSLISAVICAACQPPTSTPVILETPQIGGTAELFLTPDCLPASGVSLEIHKISDSFIAVPAMGLQPGEYPYIWNSTRGGAGGDADASDAVAQNGCFAFQVDRLEPPPGKASATWDIRLVHARKVAYSKITIP